MLQRLIAEDYRELTRLYPFRRRVRTFVRDAYILSFSLFRRVDLSKEWIRFLCYHHVFTDERSGFERQLGFLKRYGDFISIDNAIDIFSRKDRIDGRYFCVTFDDGFKNCLTNALPILLKNKCPAAFFISTDYIGCDIKDDWQKVQNYFSISKDDYPMPVEFLDWQDCRELIKQGMSIGSHTCSHTRLAMLNSNQVRAELVRSKERIEQELGVACSHFCCPWGLPGRDFRVSVDPAIVKEMGYESFLTLERGPNLNGADPFMIKRDNILAAWEDYQLRYFFSQ